MNGWRLVIRWGLLGFVGAVVIRWGLSRWGLLWLGASGVFAFGYIVRSWMCVIRCQQTQLELRGRVLIAEANTDHALCNKAFGKMNEYIDELESRNDALEHPEQAIEQAERITRGES